METSVYNGEYFVEVDLPITKEIIIAYFKRQPDYLKLDRRTRAKLIGSVSRDFNKGKLNLNDFEFHDMNFHHFFNWWHFNESMRKFFKTKGVARVSGSNGKSKYIGCNNELEARKWCDENTNILYTIWNVDYFREIR